MAKNNVKNEMQKEMNEFIATLVATPSEIEKYLGNLRFLYNYSLRNTVTAIWQYYCLHGKMCEGRFITYNRAKEINRFVKGGSKGVKMLRPQTIKRKKENKDGEEEEYTFIKYYPFTVFALEDTDGEELQDTSSLMVGESKKSYEEIKEIILKDFPIKENKYLITHGSTNGKDINVSTSFSENEKISTLIHEYAHNKLGHLDKDKRDNDPTSIVELEAESCAYIVTTMLGIKNKKSRLYITNWNGGDARESMRKRAPKVLKVAEDIYKTIMEE